MKGPDAALERRTRYLLDTLSDPEREAVEAEYFADDASFERLQAAEDELFDLYAAGRLTPADEAAFRRRYLSSPEGRWRMTFARALGRRADEAVAVIEGAPRRAAFGSLATWAALAACLAAGLTALWLARQNARLQGELARLRAERSSEPPPTPLAPRSTLPQTPRTAMQAVRLPASPSGPIDVTVAPETRSMRLEVALKGDEDSATFDAVIRRPAGEELWRQEGLAPKRFGAPIVVTVPADALPDGEYVLSVEGEPSREPPQGSARQYRLRLVRKPAP